MTEQEIRAKVAAEVESMLVVAMENCVCLGRDAYGDYIDRQVKTIQNKIKNVVG